LKISNLPYLSKLLETNKTVVQKPVFLDWRVPYQRISQHTSDGTVQKLLCWRSTMSF